MKKYKVKNVVFTPEGAVNLLIDDKPVDIKPQQIKLFQYFLDTRQKRSTKNEILDAVWGEGEHRHESLSTALGKLRKVLPPELVITNHHNRGYVFNFDVEVEEYKYKELEVKLTKSTRLKRYIHLGLSINALIAFGITILVSNLVYDTLYPTPRYVLNYTDPFFTRDYIVDGPQISPDGRYIAHRLSRELFVDDNLGLYDRQKGDTKSIAHMGFLDGYSWDLTGKRIAYQDRTKGNCEIKLLTLTGDNDKPETELLAKCLKNSGQLSFAWFNEHEFYFNAVAKSKTDSANGLPFHHLYSFNIKTKQKTKLADAIYQGGVGFYSLRYDEHTDILHLLQSDRFINTDFYQYHNGQLNHIHRVDHKVPYYAVSNDKLVYKNNDGNFVVNHPADNFAGQQVVARPVLASLNQPHLHNNQLVFVAGDIADYAVYKLHNDKLGKLQLNGFRPRIIGIHEKEIIFTSQQTGVLQVYKLVANNEVVRLSNMEVNEDIQYISAAKNVFVLSYLNKVDVYQLVNGQLELVKSLAGFKYGSLNDNGTKVLLTQVVSKDQTTVVEKHMADFANTGLQIDKAQLAHYHQNTVVYISQHNELMQINGDKKHVITNDLAINSIYHTALQGDNFYYTAKVDGKKIVKMVNLTTATKHIIDIGKISPSYLQVIGDSLYIHSLEVLKPKLVKGELVTK